MEEESEITVNSPRKVAESQERVTPLDGMVGPGSPEDICSSSLAATANQLLGIYIEEDHWKSDLF